MASEFAHRRGAARCAFSLIEVVSVIVILSILALVAMPMVGDVNTTTGEATLRGNLASMRNAIELYANQHDGVYPAGATDGTNAIGTSAAYIAQLTQYSNAAGVVSAAKSASYPYGPYLKYGIPTATTGPLSGNSGVSVTNSATALAGDGSPANAWKYSYVTGQLICNSTALSSDGVTTLAQF